MSHTYTKLLYHLIWGTKERQSLIQSDIQERLYEYIGGTLKSIKCIPIMIGGMPDHIHILAFIAPDITLSEASRTIKVGSSKWIKSIPNYTNFSLQEGYGAFSVSLSNQQTVLEYIKNQAEHHKIRTFRYEFLEFLSRHGVNHDEKYLWK